MSNHYYSRDKTPQQWQADFEAHHGPLADLVSLLRQNCNTYQSIGKKYGVSREMARLWRNKIALWFDLPTEKYIRQKTCSLERALSKPLPAKLKPIFEALKSRGLQPKPYIKKSGPIYRMIVKTLFLNGHKCHITNVKTIHVSYYWHCHLTRSMTEQFCLVFCGNPIQSIYVFPTDLLKQHYGTAQGGWFNIPLSGISIGGGFGNYSRINWPDYKEAWHLLERKNNP